MDNYYFLKGEKVQLRPYQEEDLSLLNKWFNDAEVTYFMFTGQRPTTLEQTKKQFEEEMVENNI